MLCVHYSCMFTYVLKKESGHTGDWNWITASKPQTLYVQKVPKTPLQTSCMGKDIDSQVNGNCYQLKDVNIRQ